jgi:hypothetical protein
MEFPAHFKSLKVALTDWVHADVATYYLACCLGLMKEEDGTLDGFREFKWVFCSGNAVGDTLWQFMDKLVAIGTLEFDEKGIKYRWNPSFQGEWERQENAA